MEGVFVHAITHECSGIPNIFQGNMSNLMHALIYVQTYLDDLLVIIKESFDNHFVKIETIL